MMCSASLSLFFIMPFFALSALVALSCSAETVMPEAMMSETTVSKTAVPAISSESPASSEISTSGISALPASTSGKYAAKNIPLPPVEDLTAQMDEYLMKLGTNLEYLKGSRRYAEDALDIVRDTNALVVLALAVGLSEADSPYKKSASSIIAACKSLASAKTYKEGQAGYETLKRSVKQPAAENAGSLSLSWSDKVANLTPVMKALPNLSVGVKRLTDTESKMNLALEKKPQAIYGPLATLAVLSQGCIPNVSETVKPESAAKWKACCEEFRDTAVKANTAAHQYAQSRYGGEKADNTMKAEHTVKADYSVFKESFQAMTRSCNRCHAEFYPDAMPEQ